MKRITMLMALMLVPMLTFAQNAEKDALKAVKKTIGQYKNWRWRDTIKSNGRGGYYTNLGTHSPDKLLLAFLVSTSPTETYFSFSIMLQNADTPDWRIENLGGNDYRVFDATVTMDNGQIYNILLVSTGTDPSNYSFSFKQKDGPKLLQAIDNGASKMNLIFKTSPQSKFGGAIAENPYNISGAKAIIDAIIAYMDIKY